MSEAISHATFMPHPPVRGAQRAPAGGDDGEKAFGDALDAPANSGPGKKVDDTHVGDAAKTARKDDDQVDDEERDEDGETGRFVNILAMTGSGHWSFRLPSDGAKGGGEADAASAIHGKKQDAAGNGTHPANPSKTQIEAGTGDGGASAEKAVARADAMGATKGEADESTRAGNARHAGRLAAVLADADRSTPSKAASHADAPPRPAADGRSGAIAEALQRQDGDNNDAGDGARGRNGGGDGENGSNRGRAGLEAQAGDPAMPKVKVVGVQNAPAPAVVAAPGASQTGAELVRSLDSDPTFRSAAADAASQANAGGRPEVMHSVKLQLQPASMGTVTATLRLVGDHLTVEIQTDNANAHHRLGTDSDSMAKALRALGYDVDRVIVHQAAATQHGTSADTQSGGGARQNAFQSAGGSAGDGGTPHRGEKGHEGQHDAGPDRGHAQGQPDTSRNGLYI